MNYNQQGNASTLGAVAGVPLAPLQGKINELTGAVSNLDSLMGQFARRLEPVSLPLGPQGAEVREIAPLPPSCDIERSVDTEVIRLRNLADAIERLMNNLRV